MTDKEIPKCTVCDHPLIFISGKWLHVLEIESEVQPSGLTYPLVHKTVNCFHERNGKQCKCRSPELPKKGGRT